MKSKLKYFNFLSPTKLEGPVKKLVQSINDLFTASGQYKKEFIYNTETEDPVDIISKLSEELNQLAGYVNEYRLELASAETEIKELKEEIESEKSKSASLERELMEIKDSSVHIEEKKEGNFSDEVEKAIKGEHEKRLKLIRSLIKFRDQLLIFRDNTDDEDASKLLLNLYKETGRFMIENEIEILNKGGKFSTDLQVVVGTACTDNLELIDMIESTFRDGYSIEGEIIRPQEIVVYVSDKNQNA